MNVLDVALPREPQGCKTVKEYLKFLLATLWDQEDGFSGKRPFGESGWTHDLYEGLIAAGVIDGKLDPDEGWIDELTKEERHKADILIAEAIEAL